MRYLAGLAQAIRRDGGRLFTGTRVVKIEGGSSVRVETDHGHVVTANALVVATNSPINDRVVIHTKQAPYMTYVIGLRVPRGRVTRALYWDTLDPYHYVRLQSPNTTESPDHDILIVGGEDHKTGQADDARRRFADLREWAGTLFPLIEDVAYEWSGQVMEPVDGLAFIGRNPQDGKNVYIATGDSGNGMTHGTIAGLLLADLIAGRENAWEALYDPARKNRRAAAAFAKENLNVAAQYLDLVTSGEIRESKEIPPGEGAVMRRGLKKIAAYRDQEGQLHECSAVCPHLACIVAWNSLEKTWDCPCHGSRFDALGRVFQGPASRDLSAAESPDDEAG